MREQLLETLAKEKPWQLPLNFDVLPVQRDFIFDFTSRFSAYGGGLGNGKTTAGCVRAFLLSTLFPGNTGFIGRFDGKELRQTTLAEFKRLVPEDFIAKQNDQLGYLKFKPQYGGSEIIYGDLKEERFNNLNLGWFFVDQAEEIDESRWNLLVSRLRKQTPILGEGGEPLLSPNGDALQAQTYGWATFNPEGTNSYLWRFFHPDSPTLKPGYTLYQASTYDGLKAGFLSQDYVDGMLAVFPENARRRYLDGSWDIYEGRVYPQFDPALHVIDHYELSRYLQHQTVLVYESIDHGLTNPTAIGWWVVDQFGNRFLVDEHYEGGGKPVKHHATILKAKRSQLGLPIAITYLDSAAFARNQSRADSVYAVSDEYNDNGVFPIQGQKDWPSAYSRITQGLNPAPDHEHPLTGQLGAPHIYISSQCPHFIKEVVGYRWKKNRLTSAAKNAPEVPVDLNDHHMDEWSYFEASRPSSPFIAAPRRKADALALVHAQVQAWNPLAEDEQGSWMSF